MNDNTARETQPSDQPTEQKGHILSLPLENLQTDREPHSYERWMIAKLMRMAGSPPGPVPHLTHATIEPA